jgi:hypothetical protein
MADTLALQNENEKHVSGNSLEHNGNGADSTGPVPRVITQGTSALNSDNALFALETFC